MSLSATTNLIEIVTRSGNLLAISEQKITATSMQTDVDAIEFKPWLIGAPVYHEYRSTQTDTAQCEVQNLSGDTIYRDVAKFFSANELTGALFLSRIWSVESESALYTFIGKMEEPEITDESLSLHANSIKNWSAVKAPPYHIGETCGLDFGSIACGSTATTPCNQSYGTCSAIERFQGVITQWNGSPINYTQISQPAQTVELNNKRPF
jgi:hypothetical protein